MSLSEGRESGTRKVVSVRPSAIPAPSKLRGRGSTSMTPPMGQTSRVENLGRISPDKDSLKQALRDSTLSRVRAPLQNIQQATTRSWQLAKTTTGNVAPASKVARSIEAPKRLTLPKRPHWDTQGILQDEKAEKAKLRDINVYQEGVIKEKNEEILKLERRERETDNKMDGLHSQIQELLREKLQFGEQMAKAAEERHGSEQALMGQMEALRREKALVQNELESELKSHRATKEAFDQEKAHSDQLRSTLESQKQHTIEQEHKIAALHNQIKVLEDMMGARNFSITNLQDDLKASKETIIEMENQLQEAQRVRRKLHNTIQELKGNIRVFCRVRPSIVQEEVATIRYMGEENNAMEIASSGESASGQSVDKVYPFHFDKVFAPGTTQSAVFEEISQLVQSALDGYNCCVFAYGQTSSGKTYTMEGRQDTEHAGMIPRAVEQIFTEASILKERGWQYSFEGQYLEIYNETINDLLGSKELDKTKHEIKHDKGRTLVTESISLKLESAAEVSHLLTRATARRRVGETLMNARSSRSHSVFALKISGANSVTGELCEGVLNLVDLAGSERLNSSGATGDRLKETVAINKSLSSLADVISALGDGSSHVPYRNSKLTYLLQNSLGGNSKTLMFVNISPAAAHLQETLCSLRFATKVNTTNIGTAKRQVKLNA